MMDAYTQSRESFHGRIATLLTLALVVLGASVSATRAQSVDAETVEAWLLAEWAKAAEVQLPSGVVLRYAVDTKKVPPSEELAVLRTQVIGHPDHPRRQELAAYEDRLKHGPSRVTYASYLATDELWRISMTNDYLAPAVSYWDTARSEDTVWGMIPEQLTVYEVDRAVELDMNYHSVQMQAFRLRLREMRFGNLAYGLFGDSRPRVTQWDRGIWVARAISSDGVVCEWQGVWDDDRSAGRVSAMRFIEMENGEDVLSREWIFSKWHYDNALAGWVAGLVEYFEGGQPEFTVVHLGTEVINRDQIERLAKVPDVAGEDLLRGKVTVAKVVDFRADRDEVVWLDGTGNTIQSSPARSASPSGAGPLRAIGVVVLLGLFAAFGWIRYGGRQVS